MLPGPGEKSGIKRGSVIPGGLYSGSLQKIRNGMEGKLCVSGFYRYWYF